MLTEVTLKTDKFVRQAMQQEHQHWRRQRNRKALDDFRTFLTGLIAIGFCVYSIPRIPGCISIVEAYLAAGGWI